jgi:hypothetical protein
LVDDITKEMEHLHFNYTKCLMKKAQESLQGSRRREAIQYIAKALGHLDRIKRSPERSKGLSQKEMEHRRCELVALTEKIWR